MLGCCSAGSTLDTYAPRHDLDAGADSECGGELPLRRAPALTAPGLRMGHGVGQAGTAKADRKKKCRRQDQTTEIQRISVVLR